MSSLNNTVVKVAALVVGSGVLVLSLSTPSCSPAQPRELDLILVSIDTLRVDRLGIYGAERSPEGSVEQSFSIPWLAANGTRWEHCWAPAGKTVPSLGSFFTALEPLEHGAFSHLTPLQAPSLVSTLREQGFHTLGRVANRLLGSELGFDRGFEDYGIRPRALEPQVASDLLELSVEPIANGERLMLWAHFMAPHQPYEPPLSYDRWSRADSQVRANNSLLNRLHRQPNLLEKGLREDIRNRYDGEVAYAADLLQGFLYGLDYHYRAAGRGGLLENAVVVFFSDHGEELGDRHAYFMHAKSLYSGVVQVPLIIAGPGYEAGAVRDAIALQDVLPLVMKALDIDIIQTVPPRDYYVASWMRDFYSLRDSRWTLVHSPSSERGWGPKEPPNGAYPYPEIALFNRESDPLERRDVGNQYPEIRDRLQHQLCDWFDQLEIAVPSFIPGLDAQMLAELGYAESAEDTGLVPRRPQ